MSVTSVLRKAGPFNGDDVTLVFAFTYKIFAEADVLVVLTDSAGIEAVQVLTTDYSVTLNTDQNVSPGGTITMVVEPATGELLTIGSDMAEDQPAEIRNQGPYLPDVLENMVDRNAISNQQSEEKITRSLKIPISDDPSRIVELPTEALRANKVLAFGANGDVDVAEFNSSDVPDATEILKGIIEIATTAEAQALVDDVRAITPARLNDVLTARKSLQGSTNDNILRAIRLYITRDTSGANGVKCLIGSTSGEGFNISNNMEVSVTSAVFAKSGSDTIGSGVTEVTFSLNAGGDRLTVDLVEAITNTLSAGIVDGDHGITDIIVRPVVISGNLRLDFLDSSGAAVDLTTFANTKFIAANIEFVIGGTI